MLMRQSPQRMAVFLARMVMPRSFSRSLESMTRSRQHGALAERVRLLQQLVDQRGLAVVDVGDDGDVAQLLDHGHSQAAAVHGWIPWTRGVDQGRTRSIDGGARAAARAWRNPEQAGGSGSANRRLRQADAWPAGATDVAAARVAAGRTG
jgi:hypothetical protein